MNETCMKHALSMPDIDGCPYCKIVELELARDNYKNVLVGMEFENIDSLATESMDTTQIGKVAAQQIQQHVYRIGELEEQLETQCKSCAGYHVGDYAVQNAKMVKALEKIKNGNDKDNFPLMSTELKQIASAALKEVKGENNKITALD